MNWCEWWNVEWESSNLSKEKEEEHCAKNISNCANNEANENVKKSDITENKEKTGTLILPVFKTVYKHSDNNNSTNKLYINESFFLF